MKYNWNWGILFTDPYFGWLVSGIEWTLIVSIIAWIIAFSLGSLVGVARTVNSMPVRAVATAYVELFRNIPLLVQMFIWFYVVPELVPDGLGRWMKRDMPFPEATSAILCLGTYTASRVAEQVRAGIESIPRGQTAAGLAMGLTLAQVYRYLLVPVAAGGLAFFYHPVLGRVERAVNVFDAFGLGLFCVTGALKALDYGLGPAAAALMGMLTGIGGGVARDLLASRVPAVFRGELYATPALAGAVVVVAGTHVDLPLGVVVFTGGGLCIVWRLLAIWRHWQAPVPTGPASV